jgi:hypothetical protein
MRCGRGSAAQGSREATAVWQRTVAHAAGSLGHPVTHVVARRSASAQTGAREHQVKGGL